jgi:hypothetical protein
MDFRFDLSVGMGLNHGAIQILSLFLHLRVVVEQIYRVGSLLAAFPPARFAASAVDLGNSPRSWILDRQHRVFGSRSP